MEPQQICKILQLPSQVLMWAGQPAKCQSVAETKVGGK